ncbi:MAG: hypothetical protein DI551_03295 [Micavibrio aeruginosavorus]|uniref:DUF2066 domain-containing protein n=1 Tax=Micavibrio aeruginosavorus TaxID=349221 RepID=A0A2W5N1L4_9BACT|nr:MAG: hypothetical protein DI551_03295 [Micavibrio aeruginosavorus]
MMAAPIYKQFAPCRTVFYTLMAAFFLMFPVVSHAETDPAYTIEKVEVDVTAENAVKAREKALDEAQVKAYQMLIEKFLGPEEAAKAAAIDPVTASSFVQDYEVTNEQLSTTRYKGTYTIRFRPAAVKKQMGAQGVSLDGPKKPVLVLPFYQSGSATLLWDETNPWMKAWRSMPADKSMMRPTVLPLGDANDMAQVSDTDALQYDPMEVQSLANRYGAEDVAVLLASAEPTGNVTGRLAINIYNNGFDGPVFVQKIVVDQQPNELADALFSRAAMQVKNLLRQNWKANAAYVPGVNVNQGAPQAVTTSTTTVYGQQPQAAPAPIPYTRTALGPTRNYQARATFGSVQDWVRMKNTLDRIYGMQAVMIKSLKPREALIDLRYAGEATALQLALQNAGIVMRASPSGTLDLYIGGSAQPVYR